MHAACTTARSSRCCQSLGDLAKVLFVKPWVGTLCCAVVPQPSLTCQTCVVMPCGVEIRIWGSAYFVACRAMLCPGTGELRAGLSFLTGAVSWICLLSPLGPAIVCFDVVVPCDGYYSNSALEPHPFSWANQLWGLPCRLSGLRTVVETLLWFILPNLSWTPGTG